MATPGPTANAQIAVARAAWVEHSVVRIEVGDAEAGDGVGPDGGLIP